MRSVLFLLLLAVLGHAETADWNSLKTLVPGAEIRVLLTNGETVRGFYQDATPDAVILNAAKSQETFSRQNVKRIRMKKPSHRGRNTLIGLAVGGGAGLTAGAILDSKLDDDWYPNGGKVVLGGFGALIGTVVGVAWPTGGWRDVYRAR